MSWAFNVPTGPTPDWENDENEDGTLSAPAESFVLHQSLRHSRNAWLSEIFPKFSSKGKGKQTEALKPPPHNLRFLAKCDVEIGPHTFHDTSFYEATYLQNATTQGVTTFQGVTQPSAYGQQAYGTGGSSLSATPTISSAFDASVEVTPELIAQVNEAAASNPILQNLLQQAAMGLASLEQLQTLGILIQTLAAQHRLAAQAAAGPSVAQENAAPSPKLTTDIVFDFRENQLDRFKLPPEIVACVKEIPNSNLAMRADICFYVFIPFSNEDGSKVEPSEQSPAIIRIKTANDTLWTSVSNWINEDAKNPNARSQFNERVSSCAKKSYLQHRLPQGDLLSQLRNASNAFHPYAMKSINPSSLAPEGSKPKRSRSRKSAVPKPPKMADATISGVASADAQKVVAPVVEPSASARAPRRRKSSSLQAIGDKRGGVQFINTIVPQAQEATGQHRAPTFVTGKSGLPFDTSYARFKVATNQSDAAGAEKRPAS